MRMSSDCSHSSPVSKFFSSPNAEGVRDEDMVTRHNDPTISRSVEKHPTLGD